MVEINKLQKAWSQLSSIQAMKNELGEKEILEMLNSRTKNTIDRIDRNIRIGSLVLFLIILFILINDLFISPLLVHDISQQLNVPVWLKILDITANGLIIILFGLFVYRYFRVKKSCLIACELRNTLIKIIRILKIYRRLFGLALLIFLLTSIPGLVAGIYEGIILNEVPVKNLFVVIITGIIVLVLITGCLFLLFRWGFMRLYGK
jgi:hypothetical protein